MRTFSNHLAAEIAHPMKYAPSIDHLAAWTGISARSWYRYSKFEDFPDKMPPGWPVPCCVMAAKQITKGEVPQQAIDLAVAILQVDIANQRALQKKGRASRAG
jgi:hypothetical protein